MRTLHPILQIRYHLFPETSSEYTEIFIRLVLEILPLTISFIFSTRTVTIYGTEVHGGSLLTVDKSKVKGTMIDFTEQEDTINSVRHSGPYY